MKPKVLLIEDDPDGRRSVTDVVEEMGCECVSAGSGNEGVELFKGGGADVVLSDLVLPDIDGIEVLRRLVKLDKSLPVLIITAYGTVSTAVQAIREGAYDYVAKPLDFEDLQSKVRRAIETRRLRSEVADLQAVLKGKYGVDSMVAEAPCMRDLLRQVQTLADTNATVLIEGESGVGKELVARALHVDGRRKRGPFVAVNCGAFTESLLESELFGHEKGAFTGAVQQHKGAFERADGGTLFLDEIGDAPKPVQVKLLRAIEEKEIIRIGGQNSFHVDVRLISATNRDLDEMVEAGDFREDLLYRLKVVVLRVPPLRERRADIRPLADRFIAASCEEHGRLIREVEPAFFEGLERYDWPGNVRQLRNVVESSVLLATEPILRAKLLSFGTVRRKEAGGMDFPDEMTLESLEKQALSHYLGKYEGNRTLAADKLGVSRRTIQRKIKEHNLPF